PRLDCCANQPSLGREYMPNDRNKTNRLHTRAPYQRDRREPPWDSFGAGARISLDGLFSYSRDDASQHGGNVARSIPSWCEGPAEKLHRVARPAFLRLGVDVSERVDEGSSTLAIRR